MRAYKQIVVAVLSFVLCALSAQAQSPKQDFRAVWFQTVWAGDWPKSYTEAQQKKEFKNHLDRFEKLNLNVACFQVRTMCDAFYDSPYEPWSQWMTGTRGGVPSYDPLAYLIEEAHKRGIEVHAWINPYRFASTSTYTTLENDYSVTHPEWVKYCDKAGIYIINPSDPEVRAQIVKVIKDIVTRYDIDGVIFDDYFYQSGYKNEYDDAFYAANNPKGLSRADWRRAQVNLMVQEVHDAIKEIHPWCRFGIGPAGVAASQASVAAKYGIKPCPSGSDWQYDGIYSEPVQWFVEHTIDYMAPQVYWPIGSTSNDYSLITPWWYYVCHHFGRHCYISQSLSGLTTTNLHDSIKKPTQSNFDAYEINRQLRINHSSTKENAPGMVFFNGSGFKKTNFTKVVSRDVWTHKAKVPAMTWFTAPVQTPVTNLTVSGQKLQWEYGSGAVRYGMYIMPKSARTREDCISSSRYYKGMSYTSSYTLPDTVSTSTHAIAVTVIDRYGFEWAPAFVGESKVSGKAKPVLVYPANQGAAILPNYLRWHAVAGATHYTVQVNDSPDMKKVLVQYQSADTTLSTAMFVDLSQNKTYYWRVRAEVANGESEWSDTYSFTGEPFRILYPEAGDTTVAIRPTIQWNNAGEGTTYVVEIANKETFSESTILYSATTMATGHTVAANILGYNCKYYVRVYTVAEPSLSTETVFFRTETTTFAPPAIVSPQDKGTLMHPTIHLVADSVPNNGYRFEVSTSENFPVRGTTKRTVTAIGVRECDFEDLKDGVYYAHAAVKAGASVFTQYGATIQFTYTNTTGVTDVKVLEDTKAHLVITRDGIRIRRGNEIYDLKGNKLN